MVAVLLVNVHAQQACRATPGVEASGRKLSSVITAPGKGHQPQERHRARGIRAMAPPSGRIKPQA